jgi:hypothetical protein
VNDTDFGDGEWEVIDDDWCSPFVVVVDPPPPFGINPPSSAEYVLLSSPVVDDPLFVIEFERTFLRAGDWNVMCVSFNDDVNRESIAN